MKELHILRIKLATILIAASLIFGSSVTMGELFSSVIVSQGAEKSFSIKDIPQYSGAPSVEVNGNEPYFTTKERQNKRSFESYHKLDKKGRCGVAYANVSKDTMPTAERGEIGMIKPSGWHTVKYPGVVDGNYLYNRCHLIAYCLTAENANKKNLITGTRYLNIEGMLPYETAVAKYVDRTGNHVLFRVTPIFKGKNLVASGVLMEAYSVEDNGEGICFNVYCYNVQPGIYINYKTGDSSLVKEPVSNTDNKGNTAGKQTFVLNISTKKFHKPSCQSVAAMSDRNKRKKNDTRKHIIAEGYEPCKICKP